jgi:hypothetical protein
MTIEQQLVIAELHFSVLRIIILFGWLRLVVRRELTAVKFTSIDKLMLVYTCVAVVNYVILWGTFDAFKNQLGFAYNIIGIYFLFRFLVRDFEDIDRTIKIVGLVLIPLTGFMILEKISGRNVFSIFGGVPDLTIVRGGHLRCQGPFRHPILAGTFAATSMPLLIGLWTQAQNRGLWLKLGILCTALITILSSSSGPAIAYGFGVIGLLSWPLRERMRLITWGFVTCLLVLHMVMKAPVWFLMARVDVFSGSTGWHRAYLIDQAIRHLNEWWLIGTTYTANWFPYGLAIDPRMADITNQYIGEGVTGGLLKLFLFLFIIGACFKIIGRSWRMLANTKSHRPFWIWCIGTSLFVHVVSMFSIGYFDQIIVFWYMLLALIATVRSQHPVSVSQLSNTRTYAHLRLKWSRGKGHNPNVARV